MPSLAIRAVKALGRENFFASGETALGFTNFNKGIAGNYQLLPSSPYAQLGIPDQTSLGADVPTLSANIAGVQ